MEEISSENLSLSSESISDIIEFEGVGAATETGFIDRNLVKVCFSQTLIILRIYVPIKPSQYP